MDVKAKRNANIELLRIISMLMIVMLHALGKGENLVSLVDEPSVNKVIAWFLEAFSISAVNIFMLISGYFLVNSTFKIKRLIELVCECLFYTVGFWLVTYIFKIDTGIGLNTYIYLHIFFPIHMDLYWFMTVYLVIYTLQPILSKGIKALSQKEFKTVILLLIILDSLVKSISPFKLGIDKEGYSLQWLLVMFMLGAYFKLYGFKYINSKFRGIMLYVASSLCILAECAIIGMINNRTGRLKELSLIAMNYNHVFVLLASVGLFSAFINSRSIDGHIGGLICKLAPMSLGVYLFHENLLLRYFWPKWLGLYKAVYLQPPVFMWRLLCSVIVIYAIGTAIDYARIRLFGFVSRVIAKRR